MRPIALLSLFVWLASSISAQTGLPSDASKAKAEFEQAVTKLRTAYLEKIIENRKELLTKIDSSRSAYLAKLQDLMTEETKKGNLEGAKAVKAEKDRLSSINKQEKLLIDAETTFSKSLINLIDEELKKDRFFANKKGSVVSKNSTKTLSPKMTNEKSIKEVFDLDGKWRIENSGLKLQAGASLTNNENIIGDFSVSLTCSINIKEKRLSKVNFEACGETFSINSQGNHVIRLDRKGGKLIFRSGTLPFQELSIKEENLKSPTNVKIYCSSFKNEETDNRIFVDCTIRAISINFTPLLD